MWLLWLEQPLYVYSQIRQPIPPISQIPSLPPLSMARTFSILFSLQIFQDPSRIKKLFSSILSTSWCLAAQNLILCMLVFFSPAQSMGTLDMQSEPLPHLLSEGIVPITTPGRKCQWSWRTFSFYITYRMREVAGPLANVVMITYLSLN